MQLYYDKVILRSFTFLREYLFFTILHCLKPYAMSKCHQQWRNNKTPEKSSNNEKKTFTFFYHHCL